MTSGNLAEVVALVERLRPALERGDRSTTNDIIARLAALRAPMGEQWQDLARLAAGNCELRLARVAIDLFVEALGGGPAALFHKAAFLAMIGAHAEADAILQSVPNNFPDPVTNALSRGSSALGFGRTEDARRYFEMVTRSRPQSGRAWYSLSLTVDLSQEPELAYRLAASARAVESAPPRERVDYDYALGKMHADRGDHAAAFEAFARGAQRMRSLLDYDRDTDRQDAEEAIEGYDPGVIASIARQQTEPTARTIFVTGLPRSGTTLVEQVLTSHSAVSDGGETGRLLILSNEIGGKSSAALDRYVATHGAAPAARLWHHWFDELYGVDGRIVDKTVDNSRFLGLAAALLPEAPLIWITRDPLDRAWSCLRTNFGGMSVPWSYDQEDIAAHVRLEDQLLVRWRAILGERLLVVAFEDLVTKSETWIRRILAHCDLGEEPAVFAPHENRRPVMTASMLQVRQPINRNGIGTAEPYRAFLSPFLQAYGG